MANRTRNESMHGVQMKAEMNAGPSFPSKAIFFDEWIEGENGLTQVRTVFKNWMKYMNPIQTGSSLFSSLLIDPRVSVEEQLKNFMQPIDEPQSTVRNKKQKLSQKAVQKMKHPHPNIFKRKKRIHIRNRNAVAVDDSKSEETIRSRVTPELSNPSGKLNN